MVVRPAGHAGGDQSASQWGSPLLSRELGSHCRQLDRAPQLSFHSGPDHPRAQGHPPQFRWFAVVLLCHAQRARVVVRPAGHAGGDQSASQWGSPLLSR
ncbi:hypothetical protein C7E18_22000, partial [Stenotrophomonas maltophilia]